jgi:hypothetical protein
MGGRVPAHGAGWCFRLFGEGFSLFLLFQFPARDKLVPAGGTRNLDPCFRDPVAVYVILFLAVGTLDNHDSVGPWRDLLLSLSPPGGEVKIFLRGFLVGLEEAFCLSGRDKFSPLLTHEGRKGFFKT